MQIQFEMPEKAAVKQAIQMFVGENVTDSWATVLAEVLHAQSFSDIERVLKGLRRQAVVNGCSLEELFPRVVRQYIEGQSKSAKKDIALRLAEAGLSQRSINDLTGLSRDTLRKLNQTDDDLVELR